MFRVNCKQHLHYFYSHCRCFAVVPHWASPLLAGPRGRRPHVVGGNAEALVNRVPGYCIPSSSSSVVLLPCRLYSFHFVVLAPTSAFFPHLFSQFLVFSARAAVLFSFLLPVLLFFCLAASLYPPSSFRLSLAASLCSPLWFRLSLAASLFCPCFFFFLLTASLCPSSSLPPSLAASLCVPYSSSFAAPASLRSLLFISSSWRPPCPFFRGSRLPAPVLPSWPLLLLHGRLPTSLFSLFAPPLFPLFFCPCFFSFC